MAQRNEVTGLLGSHDAGDARNAQYVTLLGGAALDDGQGGGLHDDAAFGDRDAVGCGLGADVDHVGLALGVEMGKGRRSEEHTSELQSLAYLVCRLLLEKKKKQQRPERHDTTHYTTCVRHI